MNDMILVNASGTKLGGAKTIIDTYLHWINDQDPQQEYVFILGYQPEFKLNKNIKIINKATSGINTFLFSVLFIFYYVLTIRPKKLISFNNVNLLIPWLERETYFHQPKLFEPQFSIKKMLYHMALKLLKNNKFITQSEFVKSMFLAKYPNYNVIAKWPGFTVPESKPGELSTYCHQLKRQKKKILLVPITDIRMSHKNFELIDIYVEYFKKSDIEIVVTSEQFNKEEHSNIHYVGNCKREELFDLYQIVDGILFPSNAETVGLPIFEAASTGLPVWVLKRDYSTHFYQQFNEPKNIILFEQDDLIENLHFDGRYTSIPTNIYSTSDWAF